MNEQKNEMQRRNENENYRKDRQNRNHSSLSFFHPFLNLFDDSFFNGDDERISLENGYLNVQAKFDHSSKEGEGKYIHYERSSGNYSRSFYVGNSVKKSDINASTNNGVLTITIPKNKPQQEEDKYIEIK